MAITHNQNQYRKTDYQGIWIALALVITGVIVFAAYSTYNAETDPYAVEETTRSTVVNDTNDDGYIPTISEE